MMHHTDNRMRNINVCTLFIMSIMLLATIAGAICLNISRDSFVMANSVLGIAILILDLLFMLCTVLHSFPEGDSLSANSCFPERKKAAVY